MKTNGDKWGVPSGDRTHSSVAMTCAIRPTTTAPWGHHMLDLQISQATGPVRWAAGALLAAWLAIHAGCAGANGPNGLNAPVGAVPAGETARTQIQQLIGEAACTTDADCRTIAVGDKACGGPESYLAWSARQTDPQRLTAAAERYTSERKAQNQQSGMVSNCAFLTDPGARCETVSAQPGRCVLRRGDFGIQAN